MAKRSVPSDRIVVDPLFSIPDGAEDQFTYDREHAYEEYGLDENGLEINLDDEFDYETPDDESDEPLLEVPDDFVIVSQSLRRAAGGQQVVDIVIECEDITGATNYEIQVVKI